jgi:rRNA pseudouridine-1189 N-methylase Emg1 (Nep1/Mra1 family)
VKRRTQNRCQIKEPAQTATPWNENTLMLNNMVQQGVKTKPADISSMYCRPNIIHAMLRTH